MDKKQLTIQLLPQKIPSDLILIVHRRSQKLLLQAQHLPHNSHTSRHKKRRVQFGILIHIGCNFRAFLAHLLSDTDWNRDTYFHFDISDNFLLKCYLLWILFLTFAKIFNKGTFTIPTLGNI